ncbi:hypothetical protein [Nocardioides jensenii]|uniref:hypothetical protein n=1 Tax=Nocardioides jensenii TaxID=1843 RepID=UPI00082F8238|nr:hypothetical protein [Nocardioides jensenii]
MSKMDDLRKMREARYEAAAARAKQAAPKPATAAKSERAPVAPAKPRADAEAAPAEGMVPADDQAPTEELCGHRNMGGRTCTREKGHAAKSHRYS